MNDTKRKIWTAGLTMLALVAAAMMIAGSQTGCANNAAGYRAVTVTVKVGNETGRTLAAVCRVRRLACVKKHTAVRTVELEECLRYCHRALDRWTKIVRPAINTATEATFAGLEIARQARKVDATWIAKLRPAVCALIRSVTQWRDLLGKKAEGLLGLLGSVEGFVCYK
jgi:hypothetical protein